MPPPEEKKWPHQSPFISPLIGAIPPLQSPVTGAFNSEPLKLLQHRPLKAIGLPRLCPIKGRPALGEDSHTSNAPSLSPQRALAVALLSRSSAAGETPLHRLPSRGNPIIELACPSFPYPTPRSELSGTGAARGRDSVSSRACQWPPVHGGPGRRGPRTRGLGPRVFL
jgi:hypothetical protein